MDKYRFLNNGYICLPNVDDATEFHNTIRSMKIMGFHDEEITCMNIFSFLVLPFFILFCFNYIENAIELV